MTFVLQQRLPSRGYPSTLGRHDEASSSARKHQKDGEKRAFTHLQGEVTKRERRSSENVFACRQVVSVSELFLQKTVMKRAVMFRNKTILLELYVLVLCVCVCVHAERRCSACTPEQVQLSVSSYTLAAH